MLYPYLQLIKETIDKALRVFVQGRSPKTLRIYRGHYSQESCSSQHLSIKWMERLAFREDCQECAHVGRRSLVQNPLIPSRSGFGCKGKKIPDTTQPSKDSIS